MAKDGEKGPGVSAVLLGVSGMTRGGVRGVVGMAGQGLVGPSETARVRAVTKLYQNPI